MEVLQPVFTLTSNKVDARHKGTPKALLREPFLVPSATLGAYLRSCVRSLRRPLECGEPCPTITQLAGAETLGPGAELSPIVAPGGGHLPPPYPALYDDCVNGRRPISTQTLACGSRLWPCQTSRPPPPPPFTADLGPTQEPTAQRLHSADSVICWKTDCFRV